MSIDKKLLYELAEQPFSEEEIKKVSANSVEKWIEADKVKAGTTLIPNEVIYLSYCIWCSENKETVLPYIPFFKTFKKVIPSKREYRHLDSASFDMSAEFYFRARQKLITSLPKKTPEGRRRPKGIYEKKKSLP